MARRHESIDVAVLISDEDRRCDPSFWASICPYLSITDGTEKKEYPNDGRVRLPTVPENAAKWRRDRLIAQGYTLIDECIDTALVEKLRCGIQSLQRRNLPASFILMFDATWELAKESRQVLASATHQKNIFNFDLLAWYIPLGQGGFSPHRDRQPDDAASSFHSDQQPKFVTHWIALSDATPENSCLYMIPKPYDPGYTKGDTEEHDDPLQRAFSSKESYQHIRAIPRKAGQSVLFTHRIIHWGSQGDPTPDSSSVEPRIAISFVCNDPDFEAPLLVHHDKYFPSSSCVRGYDLPPPRIRMLLVCAQLLIYYQRFDLDKRVIKSCYEFCKQNQDELEETYRNKVFLEFVKAMKQQPSGKETKVSLENDNADKKLNATDQSSDDDEDAVMEEMLNAEDRGYGEFEDDYDDMEDELHREEREKIDREDAEEEDQAAGWEDENDEEEVDLFGNQGRKNGSEDFPSAKKTKRS